MLQVRFKALLAFFLLLEFILAGQVLGQDSMSVFSGPSEYSVEVYGVDFQKDLKINRFESQMGYLSFNLSISATYWKGGSDDLFAFSVTPLATYFFKQSFKQMSPYIEGGVGPTYITEKEIHDRDLGINFQFQNILGLGVRLGANKRHALGFRFVHYSNAHIDDENDSMNFYTLSYRYYF